MNNSRNSTAESNNNGSVLYLKIFGLVGVFVLGIACINYMNLTTAKASNRKKRLAYEKRAGRTEEQLIRQFMLESILISLISFILAIAAVNLLLPAFNQFTNKELTLGLHTDYRIWLFAFFGALIAGILSGSYPAFILSGFNPVQLVKGGKLKTKPASPSVKDW